MPKIFLFLIRFASIFLGSISLVMLQAKGLTAFEIDFPTNTYSKINYSTINHISHEPPLHGTIFIDPDIIISSDPNTFLRITNVGRGERVMYDRRPAAWVTLNAFLFNAFYDDGLQVEIQVNPEFATTEAAFAEAQKYSKVIGHLPTGLRRDVKTMWIHRGINPFGGGNNNLLIHTGQAAQYENDGILEETFVHEASHTSLDATHAQAINWITAQTADNEFISTYARDNPTREDIAESFLPYLALRYRKNRISQNLANVIAKTIPHRISYFDSQNINMYPINYTVYIPVALKRGITMNQ